MKLGHVCFIPETKDFFIAYADHPEWETSHTVGRTTLLSHALGLARGLMQQGNRRGCDYSDNSATAKLRSGNQHGDVERPALAPGPPPPARARCCRAAAGVGHGGRVVCHRPDDCSAVQVSRVQLQVARALSVKISPLFGGPRGAIGGSGAPHQVLPAGMWSWGCEACCRSTHCWVGVGTPALAAAEQQSLLHPSRCGHSFHACHATARPINR